MPVREGGIDVGGRGQTVAQSDERSPPRRAAQRAAIRIRSMAVRVVNSPELPSVTQ